MRLIHLVLGAALSSCVGAFIVPDQLVSLLTVVYSVIPPIKKGTDSRVGFGYRFGPFADFQVLLELGPQTETQPIGGQTTTPSSKRDVDPGKSPDIQILDGEEPEPLAPPQIASSRSARSGPVLVVPVPPAPSPTPPPVPEARSDWLSRWRSGLSAARPPPPPPPPSTSRLYSVGSRAAPGARPRPARAPTAATAVFPGYPAFPASPPRRLMSEEALRRLRSLYWAGQQGR